MQKELKFINVQLAYKKNMEAIEQNIVSMFNYYEEEKRKEQEILRQRAEEEEKKRLEEANIS